MSKPKLLTIHHANTFLEFCPSFYTNHVHDDSNAVFLMFFLSFRASKAIHVLYVSHIVPHIYISHRGSKIRPTDVQHMSPLQSPWQRWQAPNTCGGFRFVMGTLAIIQSSWMLSTPIWQCLCWFGGWMRMVLLSLDIVTQQKRKGRNVESHWNVDQWLFYSIFFCGTISIFSPISFVGKCISLLCYQCIYIHLPTNL
jgi:hypothetical protein